LRMVMFLYPKGAFQRHLHFSAQVIIRDFMFFARVSLSSFAIPKFRRSIKSSLACSQ
jgi:hypothetical protein